MSDLNKESLAIWNNLKPMIDEEIKSQTKGMVQRRKAKVTTAPSLSTGTIGVTEPFGPEYFIPFNTNLTTASVGDFVWVEFMYGATNAFASMYASADTKNWTVGGVLDVTPRRCYAKLSSAGWYRVLVFNAPDSGATTGGSGLVVDFNIQRATRAENHSITLRCASSGLISFVNEQSKSYTVYIDKIRYVYDSTNLKAYVDIHYTGSDLASTQIGVEYTVHASSLNMQEQIVSGNLSSAATSPVSPETVLTEYTFSANGTGDITCNGDVTVGGVLDVTPRRTSAYLYTPGWYRVLTFVSSNASAVSGASDAQIDIVVNRQYGNTNDETHRITLSMLYNNVKFVDESSRSNYFGITKIRYNTNTAGTYKFGYVDIYYDLTNSNPVYVDFTVHQAATSIQAAITASDLTGVATSPANETELAKYEFASNTYNGLRYFRETKNSITISSNGFSLQDMPSAIQGHRIVNIMMVDCSNLSGGAIVPISYSDSNGLARNKYYWFGASGASATSVIVEYWYI